MKLLPEIKENIWFRRFADSGKPLLLLIMLLCLLRPEPAAGGGVPPTCEEDRIQLSIQADPMGFGKLAPCGSAGDVILDQATGGVSVTGCLMTQGSAHARAIVRVAGRQRGPTAANKLVRVTINASATLNAGGDSMDVDTILLSPCNCDSTTQAGNATVDYYVGGNLEVGANQPSATYSGAVTITAECD